MRTALALLCLAAGVQAAWKKGHCERDEACWPEQCDLDALRAALNPEMSRLLENPADGPQVMTPMAPLEGLSDEENAQPLYGLGLQQMEPLYVRTNLSSTCQDRMEFQSGFCKSTAANAHANVEVDFVVFPLTVEHVQASLVFAKKHRLCVTVAGTGHEFYGRNQPLHCDGGSILIRPTLMKSKEADLEDTAGLGHPSFTFGAGNVFAELQFYVATHNKMIATGACPTVGIVGWALGGGHGPFASFLGLGVEQLLAIDLVLASGKHVRATADNKYADLFAAMRGGGGSTWGIVTHLVMKAHDIPELSSYFAYFKAPLEDEEAWKTFVNETAMYHGELTADSSVTTVYFVSGGVFQGQVTGVARGGESTAHTQSFLAMLGRAGALVATVTPRVSTEGYDGVPYPLRAHPRDLPTNSALLYKDTVADYVAHMHNTLPTCTFCSESLLSTYTGNEGSARPTEDLSISTEMRTTVGMYLSYQSQESIDAAFGARRLYFSESNPNVPMSRFWDLDMYNSLLSVKNKYDRKNVFGCRRCVGDDTYFSV